MIRTIKVFPAVLALSLCLACSSSDSGPGDVPVADNPVGDQMSEAGMDAGNDTGPVFPDPILPITDPLALRVGVSEATMPVPVGINTAGFGGTSGVKSPFVENFLGTTKVWEHPDFKVVFVEGGMGRLIFVRSDTVGFASPVWQALVERLQARTGLDFSDQLVVGATHTHSGPGRLIVGAMEVLADSFFPQLFDRIVNTLVDTILAAYADLEPARFGYAIAFDSLMHDDRRCENPLLEEPDMPLLRFDDLEGNTKALIMTYAIHGTVLDAELHHLSQDVSGGIERKVQELFDHYVPVLMFNSWGADMSPGTPLKPTKPGPYSDLLGAYTTCEGIGNRAAQTIAAAWDSIELKDEVDLSSLTVWLPLNRDALGYEDGEFPFEWGAVYCGGGGDGECWSGEAKPIPDIDKGCLLFPEELPAPDRTLVTVGRLGDLVFATFPGEAVTQIGIDLRDAISELAGGLDVAFFGYAQDYIGYATPEWDFYQGGYEASGAIWGPKQGDYLKARILEAAGKLFDDSVELSWTPPDPMVPPRVEGTDPWKATASTDPGAVSTQVLAEYGMTDVVEFAVSGGDPWLIAPRTYLEVKTGGDFGPFLRKNGTQVDSHGYEFSMLFSEDPNYFDAPKAAARTFTWTMKLPVTRVADQVTPLTEGTYRLRLTGQYATADGSIKDLEVFSDEFAVK
ncbi:MAG: neutral/alkaline non-lysosomal ceramidase N-terminal domain-containing protein [Deltaproteobacteria bacterium]|nr:neutral/alkaline non-lysosomal ceramidase N-terminal domain-containing protein [Deltaproteobacteria bacterium]